MRTTLILTAVLAACGGPKLTGDPSVRKMTYKGNRDEVLAAVVGGLKKEGYRITGVDPDGLVVVARSGVRSVGFRGEDKGEKIVFQVGFDGGELSLDWRRLNSAIKKELGRIRDQKKKQKKG
ncbi:MAG: hypothetical protein ACYTGN_00675 [Planctomycetota bacterium]|jgi:hypothetical protein